MCGPSSTRLTSYIKGQYANSLLSTLDTLFYVHSLREGGLEKADKAQEEKMETLCKELKGVWLIPGVMKLSVYFFINVYSRM